MKLTKESAQLIQKHGPRTNPETGLSTGVVKGNKGQIKAFVQFAKRPGSLLTNPALLAGAAGIMAQVAMQQAMNEIPTISPRSTRKSTIAPRPEGRGAGPDDWRGLRP